MLSCAAMRCERREIGALQDHLGVIAKRRFRCGRIVLRTDCQNDAALAQLPDVSLKREMCFSRRAPFTERDTVRPVIAEDAAP
jgi:hypothetical protein